MLKYKLFVIFMILVANIFSMNFFLDWLNSNSWGLFWLSLVGIFVLQVVSVSLTVFVWKFRRKDNSEAKRESEEPQDTTAKM